ncbi:MAG: flagellar motor switch protein FliN [Bryobacteraceae bacterium]|nr:flagellar motor switch protein FliN [Bryobacteraceae bacterium]
MDSQRALLEGWPADFARSLEMMTGSAVRVAAEPGPAASSLWWENRLTGDPPLRLSVGASREAWFGIGSAVLEAAGVEGSDEAEIRSTYLELVEQAASAVAGSLSKPGQRVESQSGAEAAAPEGTRHRVTVELGDHTFAIELVAQADGSVAIRQQEQPATMAAAAGAGGGPALTAGSTEQSGGWGLGPPSRTMDALLDVHLPVSISFGQARMPLKDVLKLTAGTVVELNRQPEDPVDIIVNDCVIARGEVVVVDGNYAVRIQSIIGRQERLGLRIGKSDNGRAGS